MKISEVSSEYVINYLRVDNPTEVEEAEVVAMMAAAKKYIIDYTGLGGEEIDDFEDLTFAYLRLIAENFDNRNLVTDKPTYVSWFVKSTLALHLRNLL